MNEETSDPIEEKRWRMLQLRPVLARPYPKGRCQIIAMGDGEEVALEMSGEWTLGRQL